MKKQIYNTLPNKNSEYWQFSLLPELSVLRHKEGQYICIVLTWLFWSVDFTISCSK